MEGDASFQDILIHLDLVKELLDDLIVFAFYFCAIAFEYFNGEVLSFYLIRI